MKYKAIVLDLDGTLTNSKKEITPRTKEVLMKAQEMGVKVILASGRPTYGIAPLADELEIDKFGGFILAINGARITNWTTKEIIFDQILDEKLVPELYKAAIDNKFQILTYQGDAIAATDIEDEYVVHEAFINKMPLIHYPDFLNQVYYPINKCLIVGEPSRLAILDKELAKHMEGRMNIYRSCDFFLECVPLGIDKAASLRRLFEHEGITLDEVMACGDGNNDLSMIQAAGLGVAMANSTPEVLAAADYVTLSNEEDGVAAVVEKFILEPNKQ